MHNKYLFPDVAANATLTPVTAPNNNENDQPFVVKKSTRFIEDNESKGTYYKIYEISLV